MWFQEGFSHDTLSICGTDGCTYSGPKELVCYQSCGKSKFKKKIVSLKIVLRI